MRAEDAGQSRGDFRSEWVAVVAIEIVRQRITKFYKTLLTITSTDGPASVLHPLCRKNTVSSSVDPNPQQEAEERDRASRAVQEQANPRLFCFYCLGKKPTRFAYFRKVIRICSFIVEGIVLSALNAFNSIQILF